jgi:mono/diheme cytochrome c family protein
MMKTILLITMTVLFACEENLQGDITYGEELYTADCAACHGADANGGSGPSLIGEDADEYFEIIPEGEGDMPAFPGYTDQDITDVVTYVQSL